MKTTEGLPTLLRGFFEGYLAGQRDVSPNTIMAYRDAFKLFLRFAAKRASRQVVRLRLDDFNAAELAELDARHGAPLGSEVAELRQLVGGQPYLAR